jgi:GTP cyclohydrolase I
MSPEFAFQMLVGSLMSHPERLIQREKNFIYAEDLELTQMEYQKWKLRHWKAFTPSAEHWKAEIISFVIPPEICERLNCEAIVRFKSTAHLLPSLTDLGLAIWFMEVGVCHYSGTIDIPLPRGWDVDVDVSRQFFNQLHVDDMPKSGDKWLSLRGHAALEFKDSIFSFVVPSKRFKFGKLLEDMHDVSSMPSKTNLSIQKVGIRQVPIPLTVRTNSGPFQTIAKASVYTSLQPEVMGSHLSRLVGVLNSVSDQPFSTDLQTMQELLTSLQTRLNALDAYLKLRFPILLPQKAPVSQIEGMIRYECTLSGELTGDDLKVYKLIRVPYMSACICSKSISLFNAHCQRSFADITIMMDKEDIDFEDLINIVEGCCSAPIRALLKREDEKHITEECYDNAGFVETISRKIAERLEVLPVRGFSVLCEHEESLHQHNAVALVRGGKEYVW